MTVADTAEISCLNLNGNSFRDALETQKVPTSSGPASNAGSDRLDTKLHISSILFIKTHGIEIKSIDFRDFERV